MSIVTERGDSLSCFFSKDVLPDQFFSWYLRPTDLVGNLGYPSDTLHVLTVDVKNIEPIQKLSAKDTSGGLLIQWKPLPSKAYYTGIQILKSRTADDDYVVLDTLAPNETQYFDKRVILGSQYFYRVRPLLFNLPNIEAKAFTEITAYVSIPDRAIPETPQGLEAKVTEKGVELKWNPNPDLNLFGYMVYRGTNRYNMEKIAWPIKAHSYTDTTFIKNYSGQYVYAISVMNQGQEMSDTSDVVSAFVRQAAVVESPGGLQAFSENDGINLEWQNTRVLNNTITGYIVYRRLVGEKYYTVLNTQALPLPFYKDKAAEKGKNYEYAVSSIDVWGNQSILSPSVTSTINISNSLKAPTTLSVRNLQSGIEVSWPKLHETKDKRYVIYRSTDNNNFEKIATVDPQTFYLDKTVKMNTIYQYKVAILYNEIESETSQPVSIIRN